MKRVKMKSRNTSIAFIAMGAISMVIAACVISWGWTDKSGDKQIAAVTDSGMDAPSERSNDERGRWYEGVLKVGNEDLEVQYRKFYPPIVFSPNLRIPDALRNSAPGVFIRFYKHVRNNSSQKQLLGLFVDPKRAWDELILPTLEEMGLSSFQDFLKMQQDAFIDTEIVGEIFVYPHHVVVVNLESGTERLPHYVGLVAVKEKDAFLIAPFAKEERDVLKHLSADEYSLVKQE